MTCRIVVFDLDETLGSFSDLSRLYNDWCSKPEGVKALMNNYSNTIRLIAEHCDQIFIGDIVSLMQQMAFFKKAGSVQHVVLFTLSRQAQSKLVYRGRSMRLSYTQFVMDVLETLCKTHNLFDCILTREDAKKTIDKKMERRSYVKDLNTVCSKLNIEPKKCHFVVLDDRGLELYEKPKGSEMEGHKVSRYTACGNKESRAAQCMEKLHKRLAVPQEIEHFVAQDNESFCASNDMCAFVKRTSRKK